MFESDAKNNNIKFNLYIKIFAKYKKKLKTF